MADQLRKEEERSLERTLATLIERAQKAEKLADEIEGSSEKLLSGDENRL